ncbi:MAG TPA: helix-turn-helix transcriptional regulator [Candidatus Deferrimicrobium sp.]|nr:helix-turn-helix transcriptional regulator [Candidatus Deferrimicrobium sp.]
MKKKMKIQTVHFQSEVAQRLALIRREHQFTRREMALKLELTPATYYKNETGFFLPGLDTLHKLHTDFDISLDWFLFGSQPMHNKEKQPIIAPETTTKSLEKKAPNVMELLNDMDQDPMLLYEIMLYYCKYKKNQETPDKKSNVPRKP